METFDPRTATSKVQGIVAGFINTLVNGGPAMGGGIPAAEFYCKQQLRLQNCSEDYIDAAIAYAWKLGNEGYANKMKKLGLA